MSIAVTGSTGALGGRVARKLSDAGIRQRLIVRDASRAPRLAGADVMQAAGYHDAAEMTHALRGIDTLFFVSAKESANRRDEHKTVVNSAVAAGVKRIVYTSFVNASPQSTFTLAHDHAATEQMIRDSGLAFTFLQDNFYSDFLPRLASAEGIISGPAGPGDEGSIACVARDDVVDVAVRVIPDDAHDGKTYRLTGPEALTLDEIAAKLTHFSDRRVVYVPETVDEAYASRAKYDATPFEVDGWVSTYTAIATNELSTVSHDIPKLLGRRALSFSDVLDAHPEAYAHLMDRDD